MCDACSQGIPFTNDEVSGHDVNGDGPITEQFPAGDECPPTLRPEELPAPTSARYMRVADLRRDEAIEALIDEDTDRSCPDPDGWFV